MNKRLPLLWRGRAVLGTILIPPLLEAVSFSRLANWLDGGSGRTPRATGPFDDQFIAAWVSRVLRRLPGIWRHTCLRRATVLYYLLRKVGRPVELYIGVNRDPKGAVVAHAWLVRNGKPYLEDDPSHSDQYEVIACFPEKR